MRPQSVVLRCSIILVLMHLLPASSPLAASGTPGPAGVQASPDLAFDEALAMLRTGVNTGDLETCRKARGLFLGAFLGARSDQARYEYHIALADFRITALAFRSGATAEAEATVLEGERYLDSALSKDPAFGEAYALRAYLKGFEIALHPERAMGLSEAVFQDFGRAEETTPENPRVFLLKGSYFLYVPPAYGGGPEAALPDLLKSETLFLKEKPSNPPEPDWGKEEVYVYLGLAHKQKGDPVRAEEFFRKALAVNPAFGWARGELEALGKS